MGNLESVELRCPTCGHTLEGLGSRAGHSTTSSVVKRT